MKAGFIGLGTLGKTMANRLIENGVELTVWNRTAGKAVDLKAETADSPAAMTETVDVIFLNLFDSNAVCNVLYGDSGILAGNCKNRVIIDTTTNHFDYVTGYYQALADHGGIYLEAPVLGSVAPARAGTLTIVVSGDKSAYEQIRPYLDIIGKNIFYVETPGLATKMKLVNNLVLGAFMAALAEATVLGEKIGLKKETVLDILSAGAGNSGVLNAKREKLLREDFSTHFSSSLIYKDLHYLQDLAKTLKQPVFTASAVKELFALATARGFGELDFSAVYRAIKE